MLSDIEISLVILLSPIISVISNTNNRFILVQDKKGEQEQDKMREEEIIEVIKDNGKILENKAKRKKRDERGNKNGLVDEDFVYKV